MLRRHPPVFACLLVIRGILRGLAAQPRDAKIVPVICAAGFERENVLDDPIIRWTQPAPAFAAACVTLKKQFGHLLIGEPDTFVVMPGGSHAASQVASSNVAHSIGSLSDSPRTCFGVPM